MLPYENPDGSSVTIASDYFGKKHNPGHPASGPFAKPGPGSLGVDSPLKVNADPSCTDVKVENQD
jgi:hypothetical protein